MKSSIQLVALRFISLLCVLAAPAVVAQSADWQGVIWREPQVRYFSPT